MADTNDLRVIVSLDIGKSAIEIEKDLPELEKLLASKDSGKLKIVGQLDTVTTEKIINQQLSKLKIDNTALKITPQLNISSNNNIGEQISKQVENSTKNVDFSAIAKNLRKVFNINDNASIKEATENIKAMYEAFNVDPDKYKTAFNKLISWYEQRFNDLVYSERQKVDELNNLMLELYNQPELHTMLPSLNKASKNNPLVVTKGTLEEMKSILGSMKEVYKLFGSIRVDDKHGALIGSFGEDWDPKEYNDSLAVYIQYLQKIQELRKNNRLRMSDIASSQDNELFVKMTEQSILNQLGLVDANNKVIQSNEKVSQSERDVAQAQKEVDNVKKSTNADKGNDDALKKLMRTTEILEKIAKQYELIQYYQQQRSQFENGSDEWSNYSKALKNAMERFEATKQVAKEEGLITEEYKKQAIEIQKNIDAKYAQMNNAKTVRNNNGGNYISNNQVQDIFDSLNEAERYFKNFNLGTVTSSLTKGSLQGLKDFVVEVKSATGEVEKFRYAVENIGTDQEPQPVYKLTDIKAANAGIIRLVEAQEKMSVKTEEVRNKYTRLLAEFQSSNSAIESGLTKPIQDFKTVLDGLGTTHSIDDVKNQFEKLKTSAAEISKYLDTTNNSFNKTRNAINNYNQMDDSIKKIEVSYGNLVVKNDELGKSVDNLRTHYSDLVKLQETEKGYTVEWAKAYQNVNAELKEVRVNVEAAVRAESNSQNADRNSQYQIQQRYLDRIRENYITLNRLQASLVNAGQNETAEIQRQIKQVRSRISYATEQLKKRELFANVEAQINEYENEFDRKQSLRNSKATDKLIANYTKMADEISRSVQELSKLQTSSTFSENSNNNSVKNLKIQIDDVITDFNNLYELLSNSAVDKKTFSALQERLNVISEKAKEVKSSFNDIKVSIDNSGNARSFEKQVASLTNSIRELQNTATLTSSQKDALAGLLNRAELAQDKATIEQISAELVKLRGEIKQTGTESKNFDQVSQSVNKVISDLDTMSRTQIFNTHSNNAGVIEFQGEIRSLSDTAKQVKADLNALGDSKAIPPELRTRVEELKQKFDELSGSNKTLQFNLRQNDGWARTERQIQTLTARIKEYMATNTKAAKKYSTNFTNLLGGLSQAELNKDSEAVRRLSADFQILRSQIKAAGDTGKTLGQMIVDNAKKFSMWFSLTSNIMRAWRTLKQMVTTVKELDTAMTALKRVTEGTSATYNKFLETAIKNAKELKMDLVDLVTQSAEWAKRGYSIEESSQLAKASGIYSVVADIDNATAVQHLTTVMKTYNMTVEEAMDITDRLDNVANRYALTAADLGEILSHSVSAMKVAGNTLDEVIALGGAITQVTGSANEAGSTLKVLSMRLRGAKSDLESASEDTEGMVESTSKLREQIMALTNVNGTGGFDIMADADNFKSTYEIMEGISKVWKDISDVNQANKICLYVQKCA